MGIYFLYRREDYYINSSRANVPVYPLGTILNVAYVLKINLSTYETDSDYNARAMGSLTAYHSEVQEDLFQEGEALLFQAGASQGPFLFI
jgi:hypothetical protein